MKPLKCRVCGEPARIQVFWPPLRAGWVAVCEPHWFGWVWLTTMLSLCGVVAVKKVKR